MRRLIVGGVGCGGFVVCSVRRRAEIVSEARDAADLRADGLIAALVVERAIDDVALDLIVWDRVPLSRRDARKRSLSNFVEMEVCVAVEVVVLAFDVTPSEEAEDNAVALSVSILISSRMRV